MHPLDEPGRVERRGPTPQTAGEWSRLALGVLCILHQLVWVSLGHEPLIPVWTAGVTLLTGLALSIAGRKGGA